MISVEDYLFFVDAALDGMVGIVPALGDELANRRPDAAGTNSPYVILTHCLGVMEHWGGYMVAGRPVQRDRAAEFTAHGPVQPLLERAAEARRRLERDIADAQPTARPRGVPDPDVATLPIATTQGGVLLHIYEELSQHLGQLELTRDILEATAGRAR